MGGEQGSRLEMGNMLLLQVKSTSVLPQDETWIEMR